MRKVTQKDVENLQKLYIEARERLLDTIINYRGVGTKTYANTVLQQLQRELNLLQKRSNEFIGTDIPAEYRQSLRDVYDYFRKTRLRMKAPSAFAALHTDALYEISREMQFQIVDGLAQVGRQVIRYVDVARAEALRAAGLYQTGVKIASGGTVQDMRSALIEQLQAEGFMTVQYGEGDRARQVPVDVYASMVARSTSREAGNTARLNQLAYNGYDFVQLTEHYPTCKVCSMHQGRVYSISGNDKRFPPLSRAFGAYNNIHPNCRHVAVPWVESLKSPEEVQNAVKSSNRPFEDSRSAKEVALYNEQQAKGRRVRNDLYQYERYKARLGDDAPKSYREFARIKKADGEKWGMLQLDYKRRNDLHLHPEKALPNVEKAIIQDAKFTGYFFAPDSERGASKGVAFTSRLGYNQDNWEAMRDEMLTAVKNNPAKFTKESAYGKYFEVPMVVRGLKDRPMDILTSWEVRDDASPRLVTAYPNNRKE